VSVLCKHLKDTLKYLHIEQMSAVMTHCSLCTEDLNKNSIFKRVVVVVVVIAAVVVVTVITD
jgi:hypothetical protein